MLQDIVYHVQEQEMEIEALEAILMDEFKEIHSGESGLNTSNQCFQVTLSPQDDEADESTMPPVQDFIFIMDISLWLKLLFAVELALIFSHTEKYPDEPPLLNVKSLRGIQAGDLKILKEKLEQEASENLGMAMIYTLVTSAKEWLSERYSQDAGIDNTGEEELEKDEVIVPHGEPVTVETFLAWRERFEAELALERAKLMPESALTAPKEKKLTGRQWFESGRATAVSQKGAVTVNEVSDDEDDEDIDFDDDDFEDDEVDMLEHYLAEKSDSSTHSSRQPS
ncbi:RWD domain-containing protein [Citrus sinensis]|uniref:RWD domain-containing protein n=1 Tax=Citrus sinensis TaxID=2711 RepID=A0ACB8J6N7_CITSI|nr:RWD domain-containing protein [Citrus sinensis]KAH9713196.1 RWD domain-containing protein [Citrus sinensis]